MLASPRGAHNPRARVIPRGPGPLGAPQIFLDQAPVERDRRQSQRLAAVEGIDDDSTASGRRSLLTQDSLTILASIVRECRRIRRAPIASSGARNYRTRLASGSRRRRATHGDRRQNLPLRGGEPGDPPRVRASRIHGVPGGAGAAAAAWSSWAIPVKRVASVEAVSGGASITRPP